MRKTEHGGKARQTDVGERGTKREGEAEKELCPRESDARVKAPERKPGQWEGHESELSSLNSRPGCVLTTPGALYHPGVLTA